MADKETKLEKIRKKPGMSNAGKYKLSKTNAGGKSNFAGPSGTYPINTLKRAKSALRLAHFSNDPDRIKKNVYKRYPALDPEIGVQSKSPLAQRTYKKGDNMDETHFENLNSGLNIQDVNSIIQEDEKGQFITSKKGEDGPYVNTQRQDTIRAKTGKFFKR